LEDCCKDCGQDWKSMSLCGADCKSNQVVKIFKIGMSEGMMKELNKS